MRTFLLAAIATAHRLDGVPTTSAYPGYYYNSSPDDGVAAAADGNVYVPHNDGMGVAITGPYHTQYIHEPSSDYYDTFAQTGAEGVMLHPETDLAVTTTGYHWYGQEPLALNKAGVRFVEHPNIY